MNQLNTIEPDDIERLRPEELVRLLDFLLRNEARNRLLGKHGIFVPFQITVPDGGRDGKWEAPITDCEYIPRPLTYYQCKAQAMTDSDCRAELLRRDKPSDIQLKEKVSEVLEKGGAYVFFCSHSCVNIDDRIKAARKALTDAGRSKAELDCIDFLDANRIAAWVNMHASAFAFVSQLTTRFQPVGLRTIESWGEDPIFRYGFQPNDFLIETIRNLREWLSKPQQVARISGPSGLGKTRLGYEVFHYDKIEQDQVRTVLAASVAYTDVQFYGEDVFGWIDQLCLLGISGIIVVDNCSREWHQRLSSVVSRDSSRLSLLSLDYEAEALRTEFLHVPLTPEKLRDVVPKILRAVPELAGLDDAEISRIADFAQGFPQMAILTAQAGGAVDYNTLNYEGRLADRLLWGREAPNDEARNLIRCLSLFAAVGVSGRPGNQLTFIRAELCAGISEYDFNRLTSRFKSSRIIQPAGDYIMVAPPPLAAALAAEWLDYVSDTEFIRLLPKIDEVGLTEALAQRLRLLDFSEKAATLSKRLMGPNGPLSSAEVLNSKVGSQIFRALSELNPPAATDCLARIFNGWSPDQSRQLMTGRRDLVWALEKLCWSRETFTKAAEILLLFAAGENEKWSNNATGHFNQLFHLYLSGTQAPALDRLAVLERGLDSVHVEVRRACIKALGAGLEHNQFMRSSGPERRGSRPPEQDWQPTTYPEIWEYWRSVFELLRDQILKTDEISKVAVETLGEHLGALLTTPLAVELEDEFRRLALSQKNFWPTAREAIKRTLEFQSDLPSEWRRAGERWLTYIQPKDIRHRVTDIVSAPGWHHEKDEHGHYEDLSAKSAAEFADELVATNSDWFSLLPTLLQGEQQQAWPFGARLAQRSKQPRELICRSLREIRNIPESLRNPQLLRGMISTVSNRGDLTVILNEVANDPELRGLLVPLTTAAPGNVDDFHRVAKCVSEGLLPPESLRFFAFGSVTARFDDDKFHALLADLVDELPEARGAILEVIAMHCYGTEKKWGLFRDLLEKLVVAEQSVSTAHDLHFWTDNAKKLLLANPRDEWIRELTRRIVTEVAQSENRYVTRDRFAAIVGLLLTNHAEVAWPVFEDALNDQENRFALIDLLGRGGGRFDDSGSPLWNLPVEQFRRWAQVHADLIPLVLHFMSLYTVQKRGDGKERFQWHPHALVLMELGEKESVRESILSNLLSFGSTGSRVPYLDKRINLVTDLIATNDADLREIAESVIEVLRAHREYEQKRDAEHAAGIF